MAELDFDRLKADLVRRGQMYNDPEFPANGRSLKRDGDVSLTIRWRRPWEIISQPQFIIKGTHRFDMMQGEIGDCWFISSVACLATNNLALLEKCVPPDQSFDQNYAGIFHFYFWYFDKWEEVIIDDLLPTRYGQLMYAHNSVQRNEFWPSLLEKAYAKLRGNYEYLEGGHISDALCDLTGGISETFDLKNPQDIPHNFYSIMVKTSRMRSMMGCSINTNYIPEEELPNGLYKGHAYSITGFGSVSLRGRRHKLIRLRNPWGRGEWKGSWGDRSSEWRELAMEDKKKLEAASRWDEGEFWMAYEDFVSNFDTMQFCHLTPDAFTNELADNSELQEWQFTAFHGDWIRGFSAGGCDYSRREFYNNPQFQITLSEADDEGDGLCTIVVSLTQKGTFSKQYLHIGYFIFKVRPNEPVLPDGSNYDIEDVIKVRSPNIYLNLRDRSGRHRFPPGRYIIIPTTYKPNEEGQFLLRIITEKPVETRLTYDPDPDYYGDTVVDEPTRPIPVRTTTSGDEPLKSPKDGLPETEVDLVEQLFRKYSHGADVMDADECTEAINDFRRIIYQAEEEFSVETCRSLMATRDKPQLGMIDRNEFKNICKDLKYWRNAFKSFDFDNSGYIESSEMPKVFKAIGFKVDDSEESFSISRQVASTIIKRYGGKDRKLNFESFVHCSSRLMVLYDTFKKFSGGQDRASMTMEQWLTSNLFI